MTYWGKMLGGLAGMSTGRWYFALLGMVLGHQFDRGLGQAARGSISQLDQAFLDLTFEVAGHIAKRDGNVTEAEIRAASTLMDSLSLTPNQKKHAIGSFRTGKASSYAMFNQVSDYFTGFRTQLNKRSLFLKMQLATALDSGEISRKTRAGLWELAQALDFTRVELAQLEAVVRSQRGYAHSQTGREQHDRLQQAYTLLGVTATTSDRDLKKAYRRLMSQHHPDKLSGKKPSADDRKDAEQKSQAINQAYSLLKQRRGIK